jgi:hypothetical protein
MRHVEYPEIAHDIFKRHSHSTSTPLRLTVATQGNFTAVVVCHADGSTSMGISKRHTGDPTLVRYAKALRNCFKNKALQALFFYIIRKYQGDTEKPDIGFRLAYSRALQNRKNNPYLWNGVI